MRHIFVFGSNLKGIHGAGAARTAREQYGAKFGQGEGLTGEAYAIPTKYDPSRTLPLNAIKGHVDKFLTFAREHPNMNFTLTAIGTGLAGYTHEQIAPMFVGYPNNIIPPGEWIGILRRSGSQQEAAERQNMSKMKELTTVVEELIETYGLNSVALAILQAVPEVDGVIVAQDTALSYNGGEFVTVDDETYGLYTALCESIEVDDPEDEDEEEEEEEGEVAVATTAAADDDVVDEIPFEDID